MDLKQLEAFVAVAEERHFTRAAQRLHVVQSGLSQTIRGLEEELGGPLFVRSTRHVDLTPAGQVLLQEARRVLKASREAQLAVTMVHGLARGQLRIGAIQSLKPFVDLPASLGRFREKFPGIDIELVLNGAAPLLDEVNAGRLDLVFTQPGVAGPGMTSRMLTCEAMVLVCPLSHPLVKRREPRLADLLEYPFVDLKADWAIRRRLDQSLAACGSTRQTSFEVNDIPMLMALVAEGLGIAVVPESLAQRAAARFPVAVVELDEQDEICWELVVAFNGQNGQPSERVAKEFIEVLVSTHGKPVTFI